MYGENRFGEKVETLEYGVSPKESMTRYEMRRVGFFGENYIEATKENIIKYSSLKARGFRSVDMVEKFKEEGE